MGFINQSFKTKDNQRGFSLITVSLILTVIGILMIPAIHLYNLASKAEELARNQTSTSIASSALNRYFLMFGRYPVPSDPGNAQGTANFGKSSLLAAWPSCQAGATSDAVVCSTVLNTLTGGEVLIGVLPFAELNIPFTSVLDSNKNLITYAITRRLTANATYSESGGEIIVTDNANNPIYAAGARSHFVVISHGRDRLGAYGQNGVRNLACGNNANSIDFENCNKDGRFRSNLLPGSVNVQINDGTGAAHFDDYVLEKNSSVSGIWSFVPNPLLPNLSINDRAGGNVASGNCDGRTPCSPVARLDIYGDGLSASVPAVRANDIRTSRFCGRGGGAGDAPNTGGWGCINDYTLASNVNGADQTTCFGGICPSATATWGAATLPPWFTPQIITGIPPVLPEAGDYWINNGANHGSFHRGNGILCVGDRALNGIFDRDEACNNTSWISNASRTTLSGCTSGEYARGLNASGSLFCQLPGSNI